MPSEPIDPTGISWNRVSTKLITIRMVGGLISLIITLALASVPLILALAGPWAALPRWIAWGLPAVVLIINIWHLILVPRRVRAIGYAERDEDLLIRQGIFFQRVMVVPYGRMQYVDVAVGPLERAVGLATIKLHTASATTNASIVGLTGPEAARLREQLSARGEAKLAGL